MKQFVALLIITHGYYMVSNEINSIKNDRFYFNQKNLKSKHFYKYALNKQSNNSFQNLSETINLNNFSDNSVDDKYLFEGDILLDSRQQMLVKNAIRSTSYKWRNGKIPYTLSNDYTEENRAIIDSAINDIQNHTCIRFVAKRWFDFSHLHIFPGTKCGSPVGKIGGKQLVSLGNECMKFGIILHELMHSIGFWHEHSRADRDSYIRINWHNIEKGSEGNFMKLGWNEAQTLDEEYDYGSIMHYGTQAFANGFGPTFTPLKEVGKGIEIGQRRAMSETDIRKINKLYECGANLSKVEETLTSSLIKIIHSLTDLILHMVRYTR